jgi:hypothetical protein
MPGLCNNRLTSRHITDFILYCAPLLQILQRMLQLSVHILQSRWFCALVCLALAYSIATSTRTLLSTRNEAKQLQHQVGVGT